MNRRICLCKISWILWSTTRFSSEYDIEVEMTTYNCKLLEFQDTKKRIFMLKYIAIQLNYALLNVTLRLTFCAYE